MTRLRDPGGLDETRLHSLRWCFHRTAPFPDGDELISAEFALAAEGATNLSLLKVEFSEFLGEPSESELRRSLLRQQAMDDYVGKLQKGGEITYRASLKGDLIAESGVEEVSAERIWEDANFRSANRLRRTAGTPFSTIYPYSYQMNSLQVRSLTKAVDQSWSDSAGELLRQFDSDVLAVNIRSSGGYRPSVYLKHRRLGSVPLSVFGDAMRRSMLLASTLSSLPPGGVLLIDEAEAGIHVEAQEKFFSWLLRAARSRGIQIFMTTHSLEALDAMLTGAPPDSGGDGMVVYQLKRDLSGVATKRFAGDLLHRLRFERGLDVR